MGNSNGRQSGTSSPRHPSTSSQPLHVRTFDGGSLSPHGIYPGQPDYNPTHVLKYIRERRLAPFYKGLDDYEEEWTDYQLSCMVREGKLPPSAEPPSPASTPSHPRPLSNSSTPSLLLPPSVDDQGMLRPSSPRLRGMSVVENGRQTPDSMGSTSHLAGSGKDKRGGRPRAQTIGSSTIVPTRGKPLEAVVYRGAIECPVCFLFYPPNINRTRCCWKPICTECFIEMKRAEPHYPSNDDPDNPNQAPSPSNINLNPMNLVSDPVRCPFCVKTDFGVIYNPPVWLPTEPRQDTPPREIATSPLHSELHLPMDKREEMYPPGHERVVLSDHIRPDWYQHLAHRRRVEARRLATATALQQALAVAGQRRSSRPAGSRLISANAVGGALPGIGEQRRVGRRVDGMIRITRDEADEMMLQEAIRQSLQTDEEERLKREEEERKKNETSSGETNIPPNAPSSSQSVPRISTSPPGSTSSSPITAPVLPRLQQTTSTSPPSRSFFSAFRARSGSGSSRSGTTPPSTTPPSPQRDTRRPSSTTNLYPPSNTIRRQPSLPDTLFTSTTASLATAMHDSIVPGVEDSRPSVSSPLASQSTLASQSVSVPSVAVDNQSDSGERTPQATSVSTSSTIDEIVPVPLERVPPESSLKTRNDAGSVEERELVEISN